MRSVQMREFLPVSMLDSARRFAGSLRNGTADLIRGIRLRILVERLRNAGSEAEIDGLVRDLHYAWGNAAFSADLSFLRLVASESSGANGDILECGSGISTLIGATLLSRHGQTLWSLEQDRQWFERMQWALTRAGIQNVRLIHAPLVVSDRYAWYEVGKLEFPSRFAVVLCDGPAVFPHEFSGQPYELWRSGVVHALAQRNVSVGRIILDDGEDPRCAALLREWQRYGYSTSLVRESSGSIVIAEPKSSCSSPR